MKSLVFRKLISRIDIYRLICIVVSGLFLYAGISKALDIEEFTNSIIAYQLTGPYLSRIIASTLPYIEILVAGLLLIGCKEKEALIIIAGFCTVFTAAICYAMTTELQISCGCFVSDPQPGNLTFSVVRNLCIICACLYCLIRKEWLYGFARNH